MHERDEQLRLRETMERALIETADSIPGWPRSGACRPRDRAGLPTPELPPEAVSLVVSCLTDVARRRHGDLAVLRTLARRDTEGVSPVF